jgi:hypothetical protein
MKGRPVENDTVLEKYIQEFGEFDSEVVKHEGWQMKWYVDRKKSTTGPYKVETTYPKDFKPTLPKPERKKAYGKMPVVLVFKTSNRSNAKTKIKVFKNENIDYILSGAKLVGVPDGAIILEVGIGNKMVEKFNSKYSI